jgi:hypothetical protein
MQHAGLEWAWRHLAGAAPPVLALSDHQSARALFVAEQGRSTDISGTHHRMSSRPAILVTRRCRLYRLELLAGSWIAAGYQPVTYDYLSTGHRQPSPRARWVVGDIAVKATLARTFGRA